MSQSSKSNRAGRAGALLMPLAIIVALVGAYFALWRGGARPLVVYCAHDSLYSESILREFERSTGIPISIEFDTEATKSLGLVELLVRERQRPRCDVFWNNELLGTLDLKEKGILSPTRGRATSASRPSSKIPTGIGPGSAPGCAST